jgi:similar to stage IV sporulation protein
VRARFASVLRGYLTIRVCGYGAERFFRLCTNRGIVIWNLCRLGEDSFRCCIDMPDFLKLRPICRKTKTRVRIEKRFGMPKYTKKYRNRLIFFAAFFGMMFGVYRCSTYIWNIEITGNSYLSDENLMRFLKEQGIVPGTDKKDIDTDALELLLRQSYAQVIWSSVSVDGTSLEICIKEQIKTEGGVYDGSPSDNADQSIAAGTDAADISDDDSAANIVAAKNAVIASIITRKGTPCVVSGDEVLAGDVLVNAQCDIYDDNGEVMYSLYQQADADVYGYVDYTFSESLPIRSLIALDTINTSTNYFVRINNRYFCFPHKESPYEEYYLIENTHQLRLIGNFYLPIYWGTREYGKRESAYYILAEETAKQTAKDDFLYFVEELEENGVSIIDKNVMIEESGNCYEVTGHVLALEQIAVTDPVEIPLLLTP